MKLVLIAITLSFSALAADSCYQFAGLADGQSFDLRQMRRSLQKDDPAGMNITRFIYINLFGMDMKKISSEYAPSSKRNIRIKVVNNIGPVEYSNVYTQINSSATKTGLSFSVYEKAGRDYSSFAPQFNHIVCVNK